MCELDISWCELEREGNDDGEVRILKEAEKDAKRFLTCIPGHLSAPIYGEEVDMLLSAEKKIFTCKRHKLLFDRVKGCRNFRDLRDPYTEIDTWIQSIILDRKKVHSRMAVIVDSSRNWVIQKLAFMKPSFGLYHESLIKEHAEEKLSKLSVKIYSLIPDFESSLKCEHVKDSICFKEMELGTMVNFNGCSFERDLAIMELRQGRFLFPMNVVLCSLDKLQSLFWLKLYWLLCDIFDVYPGESILDTGTKWIKTFYKLRSYGHEGFFSFMADIEPLIVGFVVAMEDDVGCTELYEDQKQSVDNYLSKMPGQLTHQFFLPSCGDNGKYSQSSVLMHLELTGTSKVAGYPILKAANLLDQLREHGTRGGANVDERLISRLDGLMRRNFIINYQKKKGHTPKIASLPAELKDLIHDKVPSQHLYKELSLWAKIRFKKNFEFNYSPDLSEITKDSSCAPNRSALATQYDRCSYRYLYNKKPPTLKPGTKIGYLRSIEAYIKAEPDLVRTLIKEREDGIYRQEDHIIIQCGKELELKESSGRAFTKQTSNQRYIQVSLEQGIATTIFPFVPEQSMTDSEISIINRHMAHVYSLGGTSVLINIDLTKWCLRQRVNNTSFGGKIYDELFGLKGIYENSHHFFYKVPAACNSRFSPPDYDENGEPIPGPFYMDNFIGGCEGMKQKAWTHITSSVLLLALEDLHMSGNVMGQGDNQIVILHVKKSDNAGEITRKFIQTIIEMFDSINHKVKPRETWFSHHLHEYGKTRIWKGCAVPSGTKKAARFIPDVNDGLFSIHSCMSTINTISESIAKASWTPDIAFIMNQMAQGNFIARKIIAPKRNTENVYRELLLFPSDFGGLPLSNYTSHAIRGNDDNITTWLGILESCRVFFPYYHKVMLRIWQTVPIRLPQTSKDRQRLYEDPYSLNISAMPSADRLIKECTLQFLKSPEVTNPTIVKLYKSDYTSSYDNIIKILDSMTPCYAQLANNILKLSNAGIGKRLQNKLTSSKTIEKATKMFYNISLIDLIRQKNEQLIEETKKRINRDNSYTNRKFLQGGCPYTEAKRLREHGWKKEFIELTKPPHWHQTKLLSYDNVSDEQKKRSVVIQLSPSLLDSPSTYYRSFGPYKPYVGSNTKEKIKKPSIDIIDKTTYTSAFLEAGKTRSWTEIIGAHNLKEMLDNIIAEKIDVIGEQFDISDKDNFAQITSGNMFHRMSSSIEHSNSMVNGLLTLNSHYLQSSNNLQSITKDGEDFSVFFQMIYATNISILNMIATIGGELQPQVACVLECTECTHLLPEPKFDIEPFYNWAVTSSSLKTDSVITVVRPSNQPEYYFEVYLGQKIAESIDNNYDLNHANSDDCASYLQSKASISLNDFRRCNMKIALISAFCNSTHCLKLVSSTHRSLLRLSNDMSFSYLADLIYNSSRRSDLTSLFQVMTHNHKQMCSVDGLSAFISKYFVHFLSTLSNEDINSFARITFAEDMSKYRGKMPLKMVSYITRTPINRHKFNNAFQVGNIGRLKSILGVEHTVCRLPKESVTQTWREDPNSYVPIKPYSIRAGTVYERFPSASYQIFHASESGEGDHRFKLVHFAARPFSAMSSGVCKYVEALALIELIPILSFQEGSIHSLADGSGGCLTTLMMLFPNAKGVYNTLIRADIDNRDVITDWLPPAYVASGLDTQRLEYHNLAVGQTDLLADAMVSKISEAIKVTRPFIMTMDAESSDRRSNLEIISKVLPLYLDKGCPVSLMKIFVHDELIQTGAENVVKMFPDYYYCFYKPVGTPPSSNEYLLVCVKKDLIGAECLERMTRITNPLKKSKRLSCFNIDKYLKLCRNISLCLLSYMPDDAKFTMAPTCSPNSCSLLCRNHLEEVFSDIDRVHTADYDRIVGLAVKKSGFSNLLNNLIVEAISLMCWHSNPVRELKSWIIRCSTLTLDISQVPVSRKQISTMAEVVDPICRLQLLPDESHPSIMDMWAHTKHMIRDIVNKPPCNCSMTQRLDNEEWAKSLSRFIARDFTSLYSWGEGLDLYFPISHMSKASKWI
ncbi:RNA-dependent RNA polymerase [Xincheng Mosquito Virus]|uniref:RNA-directed RNA polymerase n=1 Tax=Xincheng Mosquito Virus TaxID=1608141 RepID=A0A0B5KTS7_9MONO|nr:RNA-dependent RNA polymerase [Xincheng Mosquito Virus]AJG39227.1 RNA-dependent RNA polymerase [Xincheng Mosquito Virus]